MLTSINHLSKPMVRYISFVWVCFYVEHVSRQDFSVVNLLSLPRQPPYMNTSHCDVVGL